MTLPLLRAIRFGSFDRTFLGGALDEIVGRDNCQNRQCAIPFLFEESHPGYLLNLPSHSK